jgi:hypothetical protein
MIGLCPFGVGAFVVVFKPLRTRVTRVLVLKNQPIGGVDEDGKPRTEAQSVRVDFKNLSDDLVDMLTVGSLIAFDGELMIRSSQPEGSEEWASYPVIECWDFHRTAASKAERTANRPPAAAPVKREMATAIAQDVAEPASFDDIPF